MLGRESVNFSLQRFEFLNAECAFTRREVQMNDVFFGDAASLLIIGTGPARERIIVIDQQGKFVDRDPGSGQQDLRR